MKHCQQLSIDIEIAMDDTHFFILDESLLDGPDLLTYDLSASGYVWLPLTSDTIYVDVDRGIDTTRSVSSRPYAGTLEAKIIDPYLDALATQGVALMAGLRLRVTDQIVFHGYTTGFRTDYDAVGVPVVYVSAADAIARLNATMISARPAETYKARIEALCAEAGITCTVTGSGHAVQATQGAESALDALITAQNSEGGLIYIDRTNTLRAWQRGEELLAGTEDATYLFSNNHQEPDHICLSGFSSVLDTKNIINKVSFSNLENDGNGNFSTQIYTYEDTGSSNYYGVATQTLNTVLLPSELYDYKDWIFDTFTTPANKVRALAFPVDQFIDSTIPQVAFIDVGDVVDVSLTDPPNTLLTSLQAKQRVAQISHRLTPALWDTQITLI